MRRAGTKKAGVTRLFCCGGKAPSTLGIGLRLRCRIRAHAARPDVAGHVLLEFLPHGHVALGELVHHRPRRLAEQAADLGAELLLLVEEDLHRPFQVVAHEALQRIAVETDDLAEQLRGEHRFAVGLVLRDDLQQHLAGKVIAGLGIAHLEILAVDDELAHILDGDVAGDLGVVETTVGILLDDADRTHRAPTLNRGAAQHGSGAVASQLAPVMCRRSRPGWLNLAVRRGFVRSKALSAGRLPARAATNPSCYQPMYWPPFADRLAPVIQPASSGMKKATA